MWFKNLQLYRLPAGYALTADQLAEMIAPQAFTPATSLDMQSQGWTSPRENGLLVHTVNRQLLLSLKTESKLLPTSVINEVAKARASEIEEQQGFKPGRMQMKEIKELVTDELLPRAFSVIRITNVWIDPANGWMAVDSATPSKADEVIKLLLKSVDAFPLQSLHVKQSPVSAMSQWLMEDEAPVGFTIDQDAELRASGEDRGAIRYVHQSIDTEDVQRHIGGGKQCTSLAMTWANRISFVLTESLTIKRVSPLDVIKESASGEDDDERFDSDMTLMTGELAKMLCDLVYALGGEMDEQADLVQDAAVPNEFGQVLEDDHYAVAVKVTLANSCASISLLQRHLHIGYNRAARLIDQMEAGGVISAMNGSGQRTVLRAEA
jgi:recombination associated protein RdgC